MTNAEKYFEVFGIVPEKNCCPTVNCDSCPASGPECSFRWWDSEYKGPVQVKEGDNNGK